MSKRGRSAETSNDEQKNESLYAVFQQADGDERGSLCDTTVLDLPSEILQHILVKAVVMEVRDMMLSKSVWKEKADFVISRLSDVCPQWSSVLSTSFFRTELHRALDGIAEKTIRLDVLHQSLIHAFVLNVTALKDEILLLCRVVDKGNSIYFVPFAYRIVVYDRNNMAVVKDVISLPGIRAWDLEACNVSNCVYLLEGSREFNCSSVLRIARDEKLQFNIHPWIIDPRSSLAYITVSVKGSVIIVSRAEHRNATAIGIYGSNGIQLHEVMLSPDIYEFVYIRSVIQKSNGNLIFTADCRRRNGPTVLTEINAVGVIQRQYEYYDYTRGGNTCVSLADSSGRILLNDQLCRLWKMLDAELNPLDFSGPQPNKHGDNFNGFRCFCYNSSRNEIIGLHSIGDYDNALTIFRLSEE